MIGSIKIDYELYDKKIVELEKAIKKIETSKDNKSKKKKFIKIQISNNETKEELFQLGAYNGKSNQRIIF